MSMACILDYLARLEENNSREWFHGNKDRYKEAAHGFEALLGALMEALREKDGSIPMLEPAALTFKLQRDTRFSHDKSPYNPCFRAHIAPKGKLPIPVGYYIKLQPGGRSFLGGGLFADMFSNATELVRQYIQDNGAEWEALISAPAFTDYFTVRGTRLKKAPRGYDPAHPQVEYLKYKSWYLEYPLEDGQLCRPDFIAFAADIFSRMQPFNKYLNRALADFEMPSR